MKLSVVIVNYNVKYFLEQCLLSVQRALQGVDGEVWVVDNASSDGSVAYLKERFANIHWIENAANVGFSKANNQAMRQAKGEYVLLLNPDTVVAEDTFTTCIRFMDARPEAGALGVHMIDGKGNFLPESKRGLPTPAVAFYKTFGLAALFPKSKTFGRYHLGFLGEHQTHEVDILSGAYMFMRKTALDKAGLLDETFFMYGEDIDLSYRIQQAGYKNYYLADTTIIHYKGESTKKGSLNYVKVFYKAMIIFSDKHFKGSQSGLFSLIIYFAIVLRGALTWLSGLFASSYLFVIDALLAFAGIYAIKNYWEDMIKYTEHYYPDRFLFVVVPVYILLWITSAFLNGAYDKPYRLSNIFRGIAMGTIAIAVLYAFIPDTWRFSRAIILLGAAWTGFEMVLTRSFYHLVRHQSLTMDEPDETRTLIVGASEAPRTSVLLRNLGSPAESAVEINTENAFKTAFIYQCNRIVFCAADFSYKQIVTAIAQGSGQLEYKILNPGSDALIGSNSKDSAGDIYVAEKSYAISKPENQRKKRLLDVAVCLLLPLLLPLALVKRQSFGKWFANLPAVLWGSKTWIGAVHNHQLPVKLGVFSPATSTFIQNLSAQELAIAEDTYAKRYQVADDIRMMLSWWFGNAH